MNTRPHILLSILRVYWKNLDAADVLQYSYQYVRSHCNNICVQYRAMEALSVSSLSAQLRGLPVPSPRFLSPKIRDPTSNRGALVVEKAGTHMGLILDLFWNDSW